MNKQKQKNILIGTFMLLLLIFVALICYIFIYAKNNPPKTYLDPDTIEIKEMSTKDYVFEGIEKYNVLEEKTNIIVKSAEEDLKLELSVENNKIKIVDSEEQVKLFLNDNDINKNIKTIYQKNEDSLILTTDGKLYRISENVMTKDYTLEVGQILIDFNVKDILEISNSVEDTYVLTSDDKVINIDNMEEYKGIYKNLESSIGTLTIYTDNSFSMGNDKVFLDDKGNVIKFGFWFNNILISENNNIYEIDFSTKTLKTSKLDKLLNVSYAKQEDGSYNVTIESTTGVYNYTSAYYY